MNALNGREFGDHVLRILGSEIREAAEEAGGIAGRFEADRFDIWCRHREDYRDLYDRLQNKLNEPDPSAGIRLRIQMRRSLHRAADPRHVFHAPAVRRVSCRTSPGN